jgi:hypothetical protein
MKFGFGKKKSHFGSYRSSINPILHEAGLCERGNESSGSINGRKIS